MKHIARGIPGLAGLFCLIVIGHGMGQDKLADAQTTANVRERVSTIIRETIKRGEFTTAEGVKGITRMPPSTTDVEEIKSYGDRAVLPLQEHFSSESAFEYEMAMRLMGALGGKRIIEPLKEVVLHDQSARKREYALRWITQGPWDQAAEVIRLAAETDPDANVRKVAQELLSGH
jgi:hypothetical protein